MDDVPSSKEQENSLIFNWQDDQVENSELTPTATRQLNNLLDLQPGAANGNPIMMATSNPSNPSNSAPSSYTSTTSSVSQVFSMSPNRPQTMTITMLSRQPSGRFKDPLTMLHNEEDLLTNKPKETSFQHLIQPTPSRKMVVPVLEEMAYTEFVQRMLRSECEDLVQKIR